jgi:hypothetical protein
MKLIAPQGAGQNDRRHKPRRVYEPALSIHRTGLMRLWAWRAADAINRRSSPTLHSDHLISISGTTRELS